MKRYYLFLFIGALLLCFSSEGAWAKGEVTFYAKLKTQVASSCSNMGKVYAGTSNSAGTYNASSSTSGELNSGQKESGTTSADVGPFYAFAQENDNYVFEGWKETDDANADWYSRDKTCQITVTSTAQSSGGYTKTLYAFFSVKKKVTVTMPSTENGSYTYSCTDGNGTVNTTTAKEITTDAAITLTATPVSGYKFFGWYTLNGTTESFLNYSATYTTTFTSNTTLYAKFIPSSTAVFTLRGTAQYFYDLNTANSAAVASSNKIIVPTANGTIPAGNYTISGGVTLLIPFDDANTLYTTEPTWPKQAPSGQSAYRKLTLKSGVNIVVNGAISVSAQSQGNQPYGGCVYGKYGQIDMESGSTITINSSANLYCWGYITGGGAITAKSGAKVYEDFQLTCWRGGTAASTMNSNASSKGVFPLAQYYIQNIEAPLTLEAGALEYTCTAVTALSSVWDATVQIVGTNSGLFHISSGSITKWYDAAKDRQMYSINGNTKLGAVVVDVSVTISSEKFVLPVTNNMDITVASGTLTCDQRVALLPGARIVIDEGATVKFDSGSKLFIYDKDEWKGSYNGSMVSYNYPGNATHLPAPYSPTCSSIKTLRTFDKMDDAELDVNGTLEMTGALYTTIHGANVRSSNGTGIIKYKSSAGTESVTYQAFQGGSGGTEITWQNISITPAKLHNSAAVITAYGADLEYLATAGTAANTTITYADGHWGWMEIWKDEDGTVLKALNTCTQQSGTAPSNPSQPCKTFVGWSDVTSPTNQEVIHTATYTDNTYAITYSAGTNGSGTVTGGTKTCGVDFTLSTDKFTRTGYEQTGWSIEDGGAKVYEMGGTYSTDEAKTFYPFWTPYVATVTVAGETPTYHTSLTDAFTTAKLKTNPTITMLHDVELGATNLTYDGANTCILDLNGHTISGTSNRLLTINNSSTNFTINDLTESKLGKLSMNTSSTSGAAFCAYLVSGTLKLEAGTIYLYTTSTGNNAVGVRVEDGEFTMNGGTVHTVATQNGIVAHGVQPLNSSKATINGGSVRAESANGIGSGMYVTGSITVNDGKFYVSGKTAYIVHASTITPTKVKIQGGYYNINTNMATCVVSSYSLRATTAVEKAEVGNDYNYRVVATYTVTFNANGHGSAPASQVIEVGQKATEPTAPTATGYTFGGWYKEAGCTNEWNFASDVVTEATPLYAKWTANTHKLSWNFNGGTPSGSYTEANNALAYGSTIAYPTLSKTGYTFNGWSSSATSMPDADLTITASWTPNTNTAYTVEHYWQNIADNEYTKHETVNMTGTTDAATAAVDKNYTGFEAALPFEQGTVAPDGSTVVKIYYNRETYLIKWDVKLNGEQEAYKEETLRYGATPSYGTDPTKEQSVSQVYSFSGWTPTPYAVNKDQTYNGSFNVAARPYTITFVNDNGEELWHSDFGYGSTPSYGGSDPVSSHTGDGYTYTHAGWKPAIAVVSGEATYTAKYNRSAEAITVSTPETVTDNTIASTTTVENHGELTIEEAELHSTTIIVKSGGQLDIKEGASVDADVFIIQATTRDQEVTPGVTVEVQVSGEMTETGSKNLGAIYYDLTRKGGEEPFLARVWYAVAVPWAVEVPTYSNGGVYIKRGEEFIPQRLGATFDLLSYDGACRATNGASANCWVYLEDEIDAGTSQPVMVPGKLYMIYLTEETSTIRFKKKAGEAIHTNTLTVSAYGDSGNDANWNGIANPATYKAYMNVSVQGLVQKFVPGTQPRDGGSYLTTTLDDKQAVGQPFFVQVDPSVGTEASVVVTRNNTPTLAPRRAQAAEEKDTRYAIGIAANGKLADRIYIQTAEEKEDRYVIGQDMSKMSISSSVAQMWVARYDSKLCLNTIELTNNAANYPLGVYAPQAGEYMIFAPSDIAQGDYIYLTLNGRAIWNLTMAPYYASLEKGTDTSYGLRIVRTNVPAVTTDIDQSAITNDKSQIQKVLMDDHVYILRGEEIYTITGQKAK